MQLELDVGNTRIKWRVLDGQTETSGDDFVSALKSGQLSVEASDTIWVSSVHEQQNQWIAEQFPQAQFAQSQVSKNGLSNSYQDPHKMGVDRWLAMLAAWTARPDTAHIVIDAGTALTMDLIDAFGRHVGGYICPGLALMKDSLLGATSRVHAEDDWLLGRAPGEHTQMCVDHGILDMAVSWIEKHKALQPDAEVWLTGGAAPLLIQLFEKPVIHEPNLVLNGLRTYFE